MQRCGTPRQSSAQCVVVYRNWRLHGHVRQDVWTRCHRRLRDAQRGAPLCGAEDALRARDIRVESSATPAPSDRRYTVKAGDTLAKIAQTFYGESSEYMRIFYANRDQLRDPDVITAGQTLVIPDEKDE